MSRRRHRRNYGWIQAKVLLEEALRRRLGESAPIEIGRVKNRGSGLCRRGFIAWVDVEDNPEWSRAYIVLRPLSEPDPDCDRGTEHEAKVLAGLAKADLPLRIPELIDILEDDGRPALVETAVEGYPLDLRPSRQGGVIPWQVVAEVAAAVHDVDTDLFDGLRGHPTYRHHAETESAVFEGFDEPLVREIHAWVSEHLPPPTPSVLLHGDLLGQNILLSLDDEPPGLIDFGAAQLGDPAYDFAIVTRGHRRPFKTDDGLALLLEAYRACNGQEIGLEEVYFYELCLVAGWYRESLAGSPGHPPEEYHRQLESVFQRATSGAR